MKQFREFLAFRMNVRESLGLQSFFARRLDPSGSAEETIRANRKSLERRSGVSMSHQASSVGGRVSSDGLGRGCG